MIRSRTARRQGQRDYGLIGITGLLILVGIVVIYTISPILNYGAFGEVGANYFLYRHLFNLLLGAVAFFVASRIPLKTWKELLPILLGASVVASILLLIPATAVTINGATRWISLAGITFQPSELIKLTAVIYTAFWLGGKTKQELNNPSLTLWPLMVLIGVLGIFIVIIQKDLGTMIVLTAILLGMMYFSGMQLRYIGFAVALLGLLGALSVAIAPHRIARLTTFLNASEDIQGAGYHIDQALTAIGSGGVFGVGLGRSIQVYGFLPEAENDSVFAIHSEIFGFVGAVVLLVAFGVLLTKLLRISEHQKTQPGRLLAAGLFFWLGAHVFINVGAMLSVLPLTGLTLPFLSYGGSSLLMMMTGLGIAFGLSAQTTSRSGLRSRA